MDIVIYLAALAIGILLGLIGGGGSILTVPVLVYFFGISPLLSTAYSLFIVGSTSFVGAVNYYKRGLVNIRTALVFGSLSVTTVFIVRKFALPLIPDHLFNIGNFAITHNNLTMVLFAALMIMAATAMIGKPKPANATQQPNQKIRLTVFAAIGIGTATGLLGAGGGFLLIPTLVMFLGLQMKEAIGTSLLIISLNSLIGFTGDLGHIAINWHLLLTITITAMGGIVLGTYFNKKLNSNVLKKAFGWMVLISGIVIIIKEIMFR